MWQILLIAWEEHLITTCQLHWLVISAECGDSTARWLTKNDVLQNGVWFSTARLRTLKVQVHCTVFVDPLFKCVHMRWNTGGLRCECTKLFLWPSTLTLRRVDSTYVWFHAFCLLTLRRSKSSVCSSVALIQKTKFLNQLKLHVTTAGNKKKVYTELNTTFDARFTISMP